MSEIKVCWVPGILNAYSQSQQVPRSADTCTRCPLEINLVEKKTWSCGVTLSKKYCYEGKLGNLGGLGLSGKSAARTQAATRDRPFGPWLLQDTEDFHFATITSKDDVPRVLHLAQLATLNPGTAPENYLPGSPVSESQQVKFSPNVIRLDISGPELPNLSFYDLPGVINNADVVEEAYLVKLVKNLVKEYISSHNSINLLALPMTDDVANSSALSLIKELKAEARTVGCLTKPDRRQEGESMDQW